ncbi:alpha/beta fold hydrolase [Micromonospora endolithica]|uniref:Alpha/beta hydrolase n=1 Tax=Micromonospora endolithica TaxID=230091 RepID=A0A3A9YZX0_9ACTN|nr:alpha/beta fold hydrolase [Micromonospora endolithica]RKN41485.1 alpha/beta hydrolase [Micromonospora endolithica]TWJ21925.1 alpha/beta hydrolase family protein [Micromonospora endolithica]
MTYVLIPGAGGSGAYWDLLVAELRRRGHDADAVDLPAADDTAALPEYAEVVRSAVGDRHGVTLVAQSLGAFTAPLVADDPRVSQVVLVNPMIPAPGETAGQWWEATGHAAARAAYAQAQGRDPHPDVDLMVDFFHDVAPDVTARALAGEAQPESAAVFTTPNPLRRWPDVPTRVVTGRDDRFFPAQFQRRLARERLDVDVDILPGGHLIALSQPRLLADQIESYQDRRGR